MAFYGSSAPFGAVAATAPLVAAAPFPTIVVSTNNSSSSNNNISNNISSVYDASVNAFDLVSGVIQLFQSTNFAPVRLLSTDELFPLAERFIDTRQAFQASGKPIHVHVGFHYTSRDNVDSIRESGLITSARLRHGNAFGRGIYIGGNPRAFCPYGEIGVLVIYIRGVEYNMAGYKDSAETADAWLGNKLMNGDSGRTTFPKSPYFDETIVRTSEQVLPLFIYSRSTINNAELLFQLHSALQSFVDQVWNQRPTKVSRILPSKEDSLWESKLRARNSRKHFLVWAETDVLAEIEKMKPEIVHCPGYRELRNKAKQNRKNVYSFHVNSACPVDCPVCMESTAEFVTLKKCGHHFHKKCIDRSRKASNKCPICRVQLGEPFGMCPKGTMTIQYDDSLFLNGAKGFYKILYHIPHGTQDAGHENPGVGFTGTKRRAYLPSNAVDILKRLKYAFRRGLIFNIGTSLTSGRKNTVIWASIHHKTSLSGGAHGFPDDSYFLNVNEELDAVGVPKAADLVL